MIQEILGEKLGALTIYNVDEAELVSKDISASIRERLKGFVFF